MSIGEKIRAKREALNLSQAKLAKLVGTSQQTIDRVEKGAKSFSLEPILRFLDLEEMPTLPPSPITLDSDADIPIYSLAEIDADTFRNEYVSGGIFPRPATLRNAVGIYAIRMRGQRMAPVYRPGDLLIVNPHQPALAQDGAVFLSPKRDLMQVGEFDREEQSEWIIKKYGPKPREITLKKKDFPHCEAIHAIFKRF